jgi:HAD superfamily hydrolase (TIGR01458 family)
VQRCAAAGHKTAALLMDEAVKEDFDVLSEDPVRPDAVIVGDLGERFDYAILNRALRQLVAGAELIALQKNRYWQRADGLALDVGPFVAALEYATDRQAYVCGKPAADFFDAVLADLDVAPGDAAIVGDDVETDVGGGLAAGLGGVLVRTGKYRPERVEASGVEPTATVDSIADLPRLIDVG